MNLSNKSNKFFGLNSIINLSVVFLFGLFSLMIYFGYFQLFKLFYNDFTGIRGIKQGVEYINDFKLYFGFKNDGIVGIFVNGDDEQIILLTLGGFRKVFLNKVRVFYLEKNCGLDAMKNFTQYGYTNALSFTYYNKSDFLENVSRGNIIVGKVDKDGSVFIRATDTPRKNGKMILEFCNNE